MRSILFTLLVIGFFTVGIVSGSGQIEDPTFVNEEGKESFTKGLESFGKEEWKDALSHFKNALRHAEKSNKNKQRVTVYMEACRGGTKLTKLEKATFKEKGRLPKNQWRPAWNKLNKIDKKFGKGPLQDKLLNMRERIEDHLYLYLATFESRPGPHEVQLPSGANYNSDAEYIKRGSRSVKWTAQIGDGYPYIQLAVFRDGPNHPLKEYPILQFWVYNPNPSKGQYLLVLSRGVNYMGLGGGPPKLARYKDVSLKKKGWISVRVDTRKMDDTGIEPGNVRIIELVLQRSGKLETIYIDDVRLERP